MDRNEFIRIYKRHFREVCLFLNNYTPDTQRIEDVVQDVFLKLAKSRGEGIYNIRAWLMLSAHNALFNSFRDEHSGRKELLENACILPNSEDDSLKEERLQLIEEAIGTLPNECREIFIMAKRRCMSYREIAAVKEISEKTVASQMGIALKRIREYCKKADLI